MQPSPKKAYVFAVGLLVLIGIVIGPSRNPFGKEFGREIVPGLVILNSLQWLVPSLKTGWRILGFFASFVAGLLMLFAYTRVALPTFVTIFVLAVLVHGAALLFITSERGSRSIVIAEHVAIAFVLLVGIDLRLTGIAPRLSDTTSATAGFLFWSPMVALLLWSGGVAFSRKKEAQVVLVCAIFQTGIGLFDLGASWNVAWGLPSAFCVWFAALCLTAYLAKTWQIRERQ